MLRLAISAFRTIRNPEYILNGSKCLSRDLKKPQYNFSTILKPIVLNSSSLVKEVTAKNLLQKSPPLLSSSLLLNQSRTVTKFSLRTGKRKTVKAVLKRFKRLNWGIWIRTRCGRNKKLWKKRSPLRRRLRQHVFVNGTQSWLLDKMVTKFWRRPKYYINDPYEPYHTREEFPITKMRPGKY